MGCSSSAPESQKDSGGAGQKKGSQKKTASGKDATPVTQNVVVVDNQGAKIHDSYDIDKKKLGEGSYGTVSICTSKATKQKRAVKALSKTQMKNIEKFKEEIRIMQLMDHPNIIKLYEAFEDKVKVYLVMELCSGGELFDRIIDLGHFTEVQAAIVMQQMFRAVYYMHQRRLCHRDLKPENFLFATKEKIQKTFLKIIDFGLAYEFKPDVPMTTKAGTPFYVAPQVLEGKYDQSADLWSCGVIMYVLLCGYPPFWGDTDKKVLQKVSKGSFSFNPADWKNVSEDAKGLIRNLLKFSPKERITAEQALNAEWGTTNLGDFKDPRSRNAWGKGKAIAPSMITTANAPVCPPETRELPGPRNGFGAHINRHPDNHDQRFFSTTHGAFYGEGSRKKEKRDAAEIPHSAGVSTEMAEGRAHGMKVGTLCGEAYNDSNNPGSNTRTQRSWLYEPDAALQNIHYGGKKPPVPSKDSELSIPIGEGAMAKVRADLKARQGRLYRVATQITKGNHHRPGISIFQDDVIENPVMYA